MKQIKKEQNRRWHRIKKGKRRKKCGLVRLTITRKKYCWGRLEQEKREMNGVGEAGENKNKTGGGIESKREKGASWVG